jgi:membrane fusion protein (multidrug efflux system)
MDANQDQVEAGPSTTGGNAHPSPAAAGGRVAHAPAADMSRRQAPKKSRPPVLRIFLAVLVVLAIAGTVYWLQVRDFEDTDDAFVDGHVIPISPQVPAEVADVKVEDNKFVSKGQVLVTLDPSDYQAALEQAQGAEASVQGRLAEAQTGVATAQSAVDEAKAELDVAQVALDNADRELKRYQGLDERAKSQQQLDNATYAQKTSAAQVAQAKARLATAQARVASANASVTAANGDLQKAKADTRRAEINLGYCTIKAPSDGWVTTKNVEAGMYVTPASQLFAIVPKDVWVIANFKETQLDLMRKGQTVTIHVDAYPDHDFRGTVDSIQAGTGSRFSVIPSENATGNFVKVVQRVPVKITFDEDVNADTDHVLSPGMSVEPTIRVRNRS